MNFLKKLGKKAQVNVNKPIDKVVGIVVLATIIAGTATLVLNAFINISNAGLALGILFVTVLPLLYAVSIFKNFQKMF